MAVKISRSIYAALAISKITNPCLLSVLVLLLIAITESGSVRELTGWILVISVLFVLLPLIYVYIRTYREARGVKLWADPTLFLKRHPRDIMILGVMLGLPCLLIMIFFQAPLPLLGTFVALLATSVLIALFNLYYRVSYHLATVTILLLMVALTWGLVFLILLAVIPVIGWAKYQIVDHTPAQMVMGIIMAVVVGGTTAYLFGLL